MLILLFLLQAGDLSQESPPPPTVRFEERKYTLQEAFDRLTGLRFGIDPKISTDLVIPPTKELNVFDAMHELCRAHGGARLFFSTYAPRIDIRPGKLFSPPTSNSGQFHFLIPVVLSSQVQTFDDLPVKRLFLTLWTTWTEQGSPAFLESTPTITRAEDNQGIELKRIPQPGGKPVRILGKPVAAESASLQLTPPSKGSSEIKILEGYRRMTFIQEVEQIEISLEGESPSHSEMKLLSVAKFARGKGGLTAVLQGPTPKDPISLGNHLQNLRFVGEKGVSYPARITTGTKGPEMSRIEVVCTNIPATEKIVAAKTGYITEWKTEEIPFTFENIILP